MEQVFVLGAADRQVKVHALPTGGRLGHEEQIMPRSLTFTGLAKEREAVGGGQSSL